MANETKDKLIVSFNHTEDETKEKLSFDFVYDPDFPKEVHPCLWGDMNGEFIQIDFNDLTIEEWNNFRRYVNRVDKAIKANKPTSNIKEEYNRHTSTQSQAELKQVRNEFTRIQLNDKQ